jgi:hypothetical protein
VNNICRYNVDYQFQSRSLRLATPDIIMFDKLILHKGACIMLDSRLICEMKEFWPTNRFDMKEDELKANLKEVCIFHLYFNTIYRQIYSFMTIRKNILNSIDTKSCAIARWTKNVCCSHFHLPSFSSMKFSAIKIVVTTAKSWFADAFIGR